MVFVGENNGYGEVTPTEFVDPGGRHRRARARRTRMHGAIADGMDFFDVYEKAGAAIERARAGRGPDAARVQDLPLLRPLRRRHHWRTAPKEEAEELEAAPRPARALRERASSRRAWSTRDDLRARRRRGRRRTRRGGARFAEASPFPDAGRGHSPTSTSSGALSAMADASSPTAFRRSTRRCASPWRAIPT